jgi:hypothetical protein
MNFLIHLSIIAGCLTWLCLLFVNWRQTVFWSLTLSSGWVGSGSGFVGTCLGLITGALAGGLLLLVVYAAGLAVGPVRAVVLGGASAIADGVGPKVRMAEAMRATASGRAKIALMFIAASVGGALVSVLGFRLLEGPHTPREYVWVPILGISGPLVVVGAAMFSSATWMAVAGRISAWRQHRAETGGVRFPGP